MTPIGREEAVGRLTSAYRAVSAFAGALDEGDFLRASLCDGWSVGDVLFHLLLDAQRALIAFATPRNGPPDVDFVSYWAPFKPGRDDALPHARFVRVCFAAYSTPSALARHWEDTSEAALRAAGMSTADSISTQAHVVSVPDFLVTLVVEATVHFLDMSHGFVDGPEPDPAALELVRATLDGLLGASPDVGWDDTTYALKGTGRAPLTEPEQRALGAGAERFPLLG